SGLFVRKTDTLSVTVGGGGTVMSQPSGINCGGDTQVGRSGCSHGFEVGRPVTLSLRARPGFPLRWENGPCSGRSGPCTFVFAGPTQVTTDAEFLGVPRPGAYRLALDVGTNVPGESVTITPPGKSCTWPGCSVPVPARTLVRFDATFNPQWWGACYG